MAFVRENLNALILEKIDQRVTNPFIQQNRLLYLCGLDNPSMFGNIGHPDEGVLLGGLPMDKPETDYEINEPNYQFTFVTSEPEGGASVESGGNVDTTSDFAEDRFGNAETHYWHYSKEIKLRGATLRAFGASNASAGNQYVEKTTQPEFERVLKDIQTYMWFGGTAANGSSVNMNTAARQAKALFDEPLGLKYAIGTQNNIYGRVDRSVETNLNPLLHNAATVFPTAIASLEMIRWFNNGFVNTSGTTVDGARKKNPNGIGCDLVITTPHIFNRLKRDAESRGYHVWEGDAPNGPKVGFKGRVIEFEGVYITDDDSCPSGVMYFLDRKRIRIHIRRGMNFNWSGFRNEKEHVRGGADVEWGLVELELRLTFSDPHLMGTVTNVQG